MFYIYPYMNGSHSVTALKNRLDAKKIKLEGSRYRQKPEHTVINYGNSRVPEWLTGNILNHPHSVAIAKDKLDTFNALEEAGVAAVPSTTQKAIAEQWLIDGHKVFVRHKLTGHSGDGIEVIKPQENADGEELQSIANRLFNMGYEALAETLEEQIIIRDVVELPDAPLYTKGIANDGEYRVHVFNGQVILYQKKSRRVDEDGNVLTAEGEEADVRNLASNWVYRVGNLKRLERIEQLAIDAVEALGLDFGAVDIIKDTDGSVFVLEVNTAPGLGNEATLEAYDRAFRGLPPNLPLNEELN